MGNFFQKDADNRVETMPVLDVIKRLDEFIMPDDKEAIIDMLELIENKLTLAPNKTKKNDISDQLKEFSGVPLILDLLNQLLSGMYVGVASEFYCFHYIRALILFDRSISCNNWVSDISLCCTVLNLRCFSFPIPSQSHDIRTATNPHTDSY